MSARKTGDEHEKMYAAADAWKQRALQSSDSLFTPDKSLWTPQLLQELHERLLATPSVKSFHLGLREQLAGSSAEVHQLAAEALFIVYLTPSIASIKAETKRKNVVAVLGWAEGLPQDIPDSLADGLKPGLVILMLMGIAGYLDFLVEFVKRWKELDSGEQKSLLADPWEFKDSLQGLPSSAMKHALLHLVFPDTFEPIVSSDVKTKIAESLAHRAGYHGDDVDRKICQIRQHLEKEIGRSFDFFDKDVLPLWQTTDTPLPPQSLAGLADELFLDVDFLKNIKLLLDEKKQVIFHGPPGTGKTFVARELARHLAGDAARVTLVQFHPSYAYEDFVQGFRPTASGAFELHDGPLLRAAEQARQKPEARHYLVIDEINRGNLAKVFGELYFLLEYRDEAISLLHQPEKPFSMPENLYIIGTMNTADRSIALVDLAMRRRFYFVAFNPEEAPVSKVLRRWLKQNAPQMQWVAEVVERANELLREDKHAAIGPSYFMRKKLDEAGLRRIWQHSVLPYIEEQLFGREESLARFNLEALRRDTARQQPAENGAASEDVPEVGEAASNEP